jgi:Flp pilus assembly protein TadD
MLRDAPLAFGRALGLALILAGCQAQNGATGASETPVGLESALRLGEAAAAGGDHDAAIMILENTIERFPGQTEPKLALANTYFAMGAVPEAEATFSRLVDHQTAGVPALVGLGRLALDDGRPGMARGHFDQALARAPDNVEALNGRAVSLDLEGAHGEAQAIYERILAVEPTNRAVMTNRALSLALSGLAEEAIRSLSPLASGPSSVPEAVHNLALAHALAGDMDAAERILRAELDPSAVRETMRFYRQIRRG